MSTQAADQDVSGWEQWRERRTASVSAPTGSLALTGTHWLADFPDGVLPELPGHWREENGAVVHQHDTTEHGTTEHGTGDGRGSRDSDGNGSRTVLKAGGDPLLLADGRTVRAILREGLLAVRVWDPASAARISFAGIDVFPFDPRWAVPGVFRPYDSERSVLVPNADGRERGLGLAGDLTFTAAGVEHTLTVAVEDDGRLWAVIADGTSGSTTFRFRFLYTPAPAADGSVTVDLNRAQLPPCAFADAFICPFPPPGNTLPYALEAGERSVLTS